MTKYHYSAKTAQTVQKKKARKAQKDFTVYRFRESRDGEAEEAKRVGAKGAWNGNSNSMEAASSKRVRVKLSPQALSLLSICMHVSLSLSTHNVCAD